MKAGTTSLFRWLDTLPGVELPRSKEPRFFSREENWAKGVEAYDALFSGIPPEKITGEASVEYTDLERCEIAAERMASVVPDVRLIFVARDPVDRMRSHYRHEVQRNRENRTLQEVLAAGLDNPYVNDSRYARCLGPYLRRFPRERILVVRFERLVDERAEAWIEILDFLGLPQGPRPREAHNVTAEKGRYTPLMRVLFDNNRLPRLSRIPKSLRRVVRPLFVRSSDRYEALLESSRGPVPEAVEEALHSDLEELGRLLRKPVVPSRARAAPMGSGGV